VTNDGYNSKADNINKLERKQVTIFRLTGLCRLKKHLKRLMGFAICGCGLDKQPPEGPPCADTPKRSLA
jgi:hypothetical protein